jgi:hypothetical protein
MGSDAMIKHTTLHKNWSRHSDVNGVGHRRTEIAKAHFIFQNEKVGWEQESVMTAYTVISITTSSKNDHTDSKTGHTNILHARFWLCDVNGAKTKLCIAQVHLWHSNQYRSLNSLLSRFEGEFYLILFLSYFKGSINQS